MRAWIVANVVPNYVAPIQNLLHQDNIGVTYERTSNFRMELITYAPLYYVTMPKSIIIVIETPFVSTPIDIVVGIKFKPQTPRGT
jgi:hypothetical protein